MYLAQLSIKNFRKLENVKIEFCAGLNIIVGPNNIGKTAIVDALRSLLAGVDDPYPRFTEDDLHRTSATKPTGDIRFEYIFRELSLEDEADFLHALKPDSKGKMEAVLGVTYGDPDKVGRLRGRRWCGEHDDIPVSSTMLENLRSVYLPPLRDAEQGLRPSRNSQLSRLLHLLSDDAGKDGMLTALAELDAKLKKLKPITETQSAIAKRHETMLGGQFAQAVNVELVGNDFSKIAARLSLLVDSFEIERNGLGYNNLIFMAVVLSELAKNADASFRSLIVEEPEAHLHPQLQAVLLRYLSNIKNDAPDEKPVQVFVTSHSPNFASMADLDSIVCLVNTNQNVDVFHPRSVEFAKGKREKLERFLDVTRAEIFFARRVMFVEGAAELLMINLLASKAGYDLREHGVSLISVEGLNFDSFLPLYGQRAIQIPVSVLTDADPQKTTFDGEEAALYPSPGDTFVVSANTASMQKLEDDYVKIFHGLKTFEYDFSLTGKNRTAMILALKEIHPRIAAALETAVNNETSEQAKAECLFRGMFERTQNNVQKGKFAQALAAIIDEKKLEIDVPEYIVQAVKHVCMT